MADATTGQQPTRTRHWIEVSPYGSGYRSRIVCQRPESCSETSGTDEVEGCVIADWLANTSIGDLLNWPYNSAVVIGRFEVGVQWVGDDGGPQLVPPPSRLIAVEWAPEAVKRAVDNLSPLWSETAADTLAMRIGDALITRDDLACLVDCGRAFLRQVRDDTATPGTQEPSDGKPTIEVGQVWADNDRRSEGRSLRVETVDADETGFVYCIVATPAKQTGSDPWTDTTGRSVRLSRHTLLKRYRLVLGGDPLE